MDSSLLEASKTFSRVQKYMFKVSRRCSWIRAFKRINSHVHRTHISAWKLGKTCFLRIFQKFISKFDLRFSHFAMDSSTSEASKKFSRVLWSSDSPSFWTCFLLKMGPHRGLKRQKLYEWGLNLFYLWSTFLHIYSTFGLILLLNMLLFVTVMAKYAAFIT